MLIEMILFPPWLLLQLSPHWHCVHTYITTNHHHCHHRHPHCHHRHHHHHCHHWILRNAKAMTMSALKMMRRLFCDYGELGQPCRVSTKKHSFLIVQVKLYTWFVIWKTLHFITRSMTRERGSSFRLADKQWHDSPLFQHTTETLPGRRNQCFICSLHLVFLFSTETYTQKSRPTECWNTEVQSLSKPTCEQQS